MTRPPDWLHTLKLYPWLFFVLSGLLIGVICGGMTYGLLKPKAIQSSDWASAPGIALPYRLACPGPASEAASWDTPSIMQPSPAIT